MVLELTGPVVVSLEVTTVCNGRCPGCSNVFPRTKGEDLPLESWGKILERLFPYVHEFRVTGGEPTQREDLPALLKMLDKGQRYYHIFTNGIWNERRRLLEFFKKLAYLGSFLVSLHGIDIPSHRSFSGEENFPDVVETIKMTTASGFEVNTNTVLTKGNYRLIEPITNLSSELGARSAVFNRFIGGPMPGVTLDEEEMKEALAQIEDLRGKGYNCLIGNCTPFCFFPSSSSGCLAGIAYGTIDPQGNVRPCNHSPFKAGSLLQLDVPQIWKGNKMRSWRNRLPRECRRCPKNSYCPAGCRAVADLLQAGKDPWIKGRLDRSRFKEEILEVNLEEDLCPVPRFVCRHEDFGMALIQQSQVIPVRHAAVRIIQAFDGKTTLGDLERRFGGTALSFAYSLYLRNFIDLVPAGDTLTSRIP